MQAGFQVEDGQAMSNDKTPTLLLIDNDAEFAYLIERYSASNGWRVVWERAIPIAEDRWHAASPTAILLNLLLPGDDGWHFLRELKSRPATRRIPVAVYSSVPDEARAQAEGADFYLPQPVLFQDFARILKEMLSLQ